MDISQYILYEDNHIIAINKPSGMLSQGDKTGDYTIIDRCKKYLKKKYHKPGNVYLHPVHRLDRPTSGVILLARTSKALTRLNKLFKDKEVRKVYFAFVEGCPNPIEAVLTHFLIKNEDKNKVSAFTSAVHSAKKAVMRYETIYVKNNTSCLKVWPATGRSHQIRVQLASIGCPIIGDRKYGCRIKYKPEAIALHAGQLIFVHPVRKTKLNIIAPFPDTAIWIPIVDNIDN